MNVSFWNISISNGLWLYWWEFYENCIIIPTKYLDFKIQILRWILQTPHAILRKEQFSFCTDDAEKGDSGNMVESCPASHFPSLILYRLPESFYNGEQPSRTCWICNSQVHHTPGIEFSTISHKNGQFVFPPWPVHIGFSLLSPNLAKPWFQWRNYGDIWRIISHHMEPYQDGSTLHCGQVMMKRLSFCCLSNLLLSSLAVWLT